MQVKHQFFYPLTWKRRIRPQSTQTLSLHAVPRHTCSLVSSEQLFYSPLARKISQHCPFPRDTPSVQQVVFVCVCFCSERANHSSAPGVFQHVLRTSCTEGSFSFAPDALTAKGPILKSHVNGSLPEAFVHTVSRMLSCSSSL